MAKSVPGMKPTEEAVERAEEEGLAMVLIVVDGRYKKQDRWELCGPVGPETEKKLTEIVCNPTERMK